VKCEISVEEKQRILIPGVVTHCAQSNNPAYIFSPLQFFKEPKKLLFRNIEVRYSGNSNISWETDVKRKNETLENGYDEERSKKLKLCSNRTNEKYSSHYVSAVNCNILILRKGIGSSEKPRDLSCHNLFVLDRDCLAEAYGPTFMYLEPFFEVQKVEEIADEEDDDDAEEEEDDAVMMNDL
jgi:hypothetical protein